MHAFALTPRRGALLLALVLAAPMSGCLVTKKVHDETLSSLGLEREARKKVTAERDALLAERTANLAEIDRLTRELADAQARIEQLEGDHATMAADLDAASAEITALRKRLKASGADMRTLADDRDRTAQLLADAREALEAARQREEEAKKRDEILRRVRASLQAMIDAGKLSVSIERGRMVIGLKQDVLFASGSAELSAEGTETLSEVARSLADLDDRTFQVEGHTDNVPIKTQRFPSNWELSTARAVSVVRVLTAEGVEPTQISATGYGEHQPRASNEDADGRAKNRRIEIVMLPDLEALPGLMGDL